MLFHKRIRPAKHYQRSDDPVLRLSRGAMLGVARDLRSSFGTLGQMISVDNFSSALAHGRDPKSTVGWGHFRESLKAPFGRLARLRQAGAELGSRKINGSFAQARRQVRYRKAPKASKVEANYRAATEPDKRCGLCWMFQVPASCCAVEGEIAVNDVCDYFEPVIHKAGSADRFSFDSLSPDVQEQIRQAQDDLIQSLESDARDAIETIIADGTLNGTSLDDVAENVRDMIGLTDRLAQAALNYQSMLYDLDPAVLGRQLRNTDYDAIVQDAIDSSTDLSDAAVENMVDDYIDNALDYRAATIAQTESTRAANAGLHDAYSQAIDRGALPDDAVKRFWQLGDTPCPVCESIPDMNPDGVGVDEDFDSIDGPVTDPPDPHPNCACSVDYQTDLTQVPDDS